MIQKCPYCEKYNKHEKSAKHVIRGDNFDIASWHFRFVCERCGQDYVHTESMRDYSKCADTNDTTENRVSRLIP